MSGISKDLARHLVRAAFRSGRELEEGLALLKTTCEPDEYRDYAIGIAAAIDGIHAALLSKAIAAYPELEGEIETEIEKYGRYL
ncbi:MAG: hypothetical protein KDJ88_10830 [Bauldia sp.]|nr:hypothetical protein [Bauldia sp.]